MLRLLSDENFNGNIVRGLFLRHPALALCRVRDVGLEEAHGPAILEWAAANNHILLTHDRVIVPDFAYARVITGQSMPGVFVVHDRMAVMCTTHFLSYSWSCHTSERRTQHDRNRVAQSHPG
jgi:predicted nuclease of predicted toxin-antitoxin system